MQTFRNFFGNSKTASTIQGDSTKDKEEILKLSTNPFDDEDDDSSPGASDNEDSDTEQDKEEANARRKKADEELAAELETVTKDLEESATNRRRTIFSLVKGTVKDVFVGQSKALSAPPEPLINSAHNKTKTPQELEQEHLQAYLEMERVQQERERQEKLRLENEPEIAKALRKAFSNANNVSVLLHEVFDGRRFGLISDSSTESYVKTLSDELFQNDHVNESLGEFKSWKRAIDERATLVQVDENFDFVNQWTPRIEQLSNMWSEVFRYYTIVEGDSYPFSLQPLAKLRYFFEELNTLTTLERQFGVYMKNAPQENSAVLLETKSGEIKLFIETLNLFSARTIILYKLLDGLKTQKEHAQKMQRELLGIREIELPDEIKLTAFDHEEEEGLTEKPQWMLRLEVAIKAVDDKTTAITGYEAQLDHYDKDSEEYKVAEIALAKVRKEFEPVKTELEAAKKDAKMQATAEAKRKEELQAEKAARKAKQAEDLEEQRQQRREAKEQRNALVNQANTDATQFLMEYVTQTESAERLTLSHSVQASLSTVSVEMLQLWLSDQTESLDLEDKRWLSALIEPSVKELRMYLSISTSDLKATILLEDTDAKMLEVLSIAIDGSPRGTLKNARSTFVSEKISQAYLNQLKKAAEGVIPGFKSGSDISIRAAKLLEEIRGSKVESQAHEHFKNMNRKTFALFGLYLLLYLQDAPVHNFTSNLSAKFPGGGGRFVFELMQQVQQELGYHLRHCKVIHDAMEKRMPVIQKIATTRSSLIDSSSVGVTQEKEHPLSTALAYVFAPLRTDEELRKSSARIRAIAPISDNEVAQDILVRELTGRYLSELERIAMLSPLPEVDRKRMKRILDLMEQLPYGKRRPLMDAPRVQLFIIREQMEAYRRTSEGKRRTSIGTVIVGFGRSVLKATGTDRKEDKFKFFEAIFNYLKHKYTGVAFSSASPFIVPLYNEMTGKESPEDWVTWLNSIIEGIDAPKALIWLPNEILDELLLGSGVGATFIRDMRSVSEETSNLRRDSSNHSFDAEDLPNTSIVSANELIIVLAFQSAVLSFGEMMLAEKTVQPIVIASDHSWYLRLRFWEAIMVEKRILPARMEGHTAAQNRVVERNVLRIIDHMMSNIFELTQNFTQYFKQTDSVSLREYIDETPLLLKVKLAFALIAEFFAVLFSTLASARNVSPSDKSFWKSLSAYFKHVKTMMGFTLNAEYDAMLFSIAANFTFETYPTLFQNDYIGGRYFDDDPTLPERADEVKQVIQNPGSSDFDSYFFISSNKITLIEEGQDRNKVRLTETKAAHFVRSMGLDDPAERLTLQHALSHKK